MRSVLLVTLMMCGGCVATADAPPRSRPPTPTEITMGYREAVDLASRWTEKNGYSGAQLSDARQIGPNLWRVRYGLAPREGKPSRWLDLTFDGTRGELLKHEEVDGMAAIPPMPGF